MLGQGKIRKGKVMLTVSFDTSVQFYVAFFNAVAIFLNNVLSAT
jgi:hypothetical protein